MSAVKGMSWKRMLLIFGCIASVCLQSAEAARFTDLSGNWSEKYVNSLSDRGVILATPDGKFAPDTPITRAILAAWMVKALGLQNQPVSSSPSFKDVKPTDWFYKPVEIIRQNNFISGYADGFRPNQYIQKAEAIVIVSRALNNEATVRSTLEHFSDGSQVPDWARVGIAEATMAGLLATQNDPEKLNATKLATRADVAALLYQLNDYTAQQTINQKLNQANRASASQNAWGGQQVNRAPASQNAWDGQQTNRAPTSQNVWDGQQTNRAPASQNAWDDQQTNQASASQNAWDDQHQFSAEQNSAPAYRQQGSSIGYQTPPEQFNTSVPQGQPNYQSSGFPPNNNAPSYLQGRVAVLEAGTHFEAKLRNTIDSGSTQPGEAVEATLSEPIYSGNVQVIPAGSKVQGEVTNVISAKRFHFGANGKVDIKFTQIETPDGRRFPLSASVDSNKIRLTGGTTAGRVGKGVMTAGIGAGSGAVLGTALGAIVGGTAHGPVGASTGMGAVFGTALGGGVGVVGAGVRKGAEVKITAGTELPIQLDGALQVTAARPRTGMPQQYGQPQSNAPFQQDTLYEDPPSQTNSN